MPAPKDRCTLPAGLVVPSDDGAADHLPGMTIPSIPLPSTDGVDVDLSTLPGRTIVYVYPRTGRPDEPESMEWNALPGARGCTPQSCGFRDLHETIQAQGARVFGLSTQTSEYQREAVRRLHLPFPLLSDAALALALALRLPRFEFAPYPGESSTHLKRMTLVLRDGGIEKVFYPVFPPIDNARVVSEWLAAHPL